MFDPAIAHRLAAAAGRVEAHARISDENLLKTAIELAQTKRFLRNRRTVAAPTWAVWSNRLTLGESRIRELARIGAASDPAAALKRVRDLNAARQKRHRAQRQEAKHRRRAGASTHEYAPAKVLSGAVPPPVTPAPPRHPQVELIIAWAEAAPLHDIRKMLSFIDTLGSRNAGKVAKHRHDAQRYDWLLEYATPARPTYVSWTPESETTSETESETQSETELDTPQDPPTHPPAQNLALRGAEQTKPPPVRPVPLHAREPETPVVGGMLNGARVISVRAPAPPGTIWPAGVSCAMDGPVRRPLKRHWTPRL